MMPFGPSAPQRLPAHTLADFLEGRLAPDEREAVLAHLANSPDDREALLLATRAAADAGDAGDAGDVAGPADAVVVAAADGGAVPPSTDVRPLVALVPPAGADRGTRRTVRRWGAAIGTLIAAAAVLVVFTLPRASNVLSPQIALGDERGAQSLTRALRGDTNLPSWGDTRGAGDDVLREPRALRIGVLFALSQRAAAMHDIPAMRAAADPLARLVELQSGGSLQALVLRQDSTGDVILSRQLERELRAGSGGQGWFDVGVWMEAVREANLTGALEKPAVRRAAVKRLDELLPALVREGGDGRENGRLDDTRVRLMALRTRLVATDWSSATFGAQLTEAMRLGGS